MKRDRKGIAYREAQAGLTGERPYSGRSLDHAVEPKFGRKITCAVCERGVHFRRRTYGPNGRAGGWQHNGNGLDQFRTWH